MMFNWHGDGQHQADWVPDCYHVQVPSDHHCNHVPSIASWPSQSDYMDPHSGVCYHKDCPASSTMSPMSVEQHQNLHHDARIYEPYYYIGSEVGHYSDGCCYNDEYNSFQGHFCAVYPEAVRPPNPLVTCDVEENGSLTAIKKRRYDIFGAVEEHGEYNGDPCKKCCVRQTDGSDITLNLEDLVDIVLLAANNSASATEQIPSRTPSQPGRRETRENNKIASCRYREKRKERLRNLKKECIELEETNVMLKKFVTNLETEVAEYRMKIAALLKSAQSNTEHV